MDIKKIFKIKSGSIVSLLLCLFLIFFVVGRIQADETEDQLFGEDASPGSQTSNEGDKNNTVNQGANNVDEASLFGESSSISNASSDNSFKTMLEKELKESDKQFSIGGKYYHSINFSKLDGQSAKEAGFSSDGVADIYFDAALDDGVRFFMSQKFKQNFTAPRSNSNQLDFSGPSGTTDTDQMWLKFDYRNKLFMTLGKQPNSWGSGYVWAPTDFINSQHASPFALSDQRLGVSLMKFQYPMDKEGMNVYGVFQTDQANTVGQVKSLLRVEKLFEDSEVSVSFSSQPQGALQAGLDFSTGLKWFDFNFNLGATKNDQSAYYKRYPGSGSLTSNDIIGLLQAAIDGNPSAIPPNALLLPVDRSNETLRQISTGFIYTKGFDDSSQLTINAEYFYNEKGYNNDDVLTLLLLQNPSAFDPLYFSKHYVALGFSHSGIGSLSKNYGLQYIRDICDTSGAVVSTFGFQPFNDLSFSSNIIVFTGGAGAFNPFQGSSSALADTITRVANGDLTIPVNADLPPIIVPQDGGGVAIAPSSFETSRLMLRMQFSVRF